MLVARCFAARTAAHMAHFKTRSYSQHMALQTFYEDILDPVDEFCEVYMGFSGRIASYPAVPVPTTEPIVFINDLAEWLEEHRSECSDAHPSLGNIIDNISAVCAQAVYRLENLK